MSTIEQTLSAGVPVTFPGGEQFHLLEAANPVDITFYDSRNRPMETWESMKGGFRIVFQGGFVQVKLVSAIGQTIKLGITSGRGQYDRSQGDVNATIVNPSILDTVADVAMTATATTQILAANGDRVKALITNLAANTQTLRIGDTNAGATRGVELAPGETIELETTEAIYGYNPGGVAQSVGVAWTED